MKEKKHNIKRELSKIYKEKNRFPTLQEVNNILGYNSDQTRKHMKVLEDDGYVVRRGDWYTFPEEGIMEPVPVEHVELKIDEKQEHLIPIDSKLLSEEPIDSYFESIEGPANKEFNSELDKLSPTESIEDIIKYNEEKYINLNNPQKAEQREKIKEKIRKKFNKLKQPKKHKIKEDMTLALWVIRWIMLIVGVGSITISIYYNIKLSLQFLPGIFAIVSGCIFVLFAVISFETMIFFLSLNKIATWKKLIAVFGFVFLWLIVTLFSVSAVLSGRYDRFMLNEKQQYSDNRDINAGKLKWDNLQRRKEDVIKRVEEKRRQLNQLYSVSEGVEDLKSREEHGDTFKDTQWRIERAEQELNRLGFRLDEIRKEEVQQLEQNPEMTSADEIAGRNDSFYLWIGEIFGTPKEKIHFYISLLPAIFFDIISSIAISVFLFLRKE